MTTDVRHIITENDSVRVETGPVQFNDDWPGVFIRGDNAAYYATMLESYRIGERDFITDAQITNLINLLKSCQL
jgi:hypothetical protein